MRIAMWSGPRNLSTAMMYAFGARGDFDVMDEPFYAPYLAASGAVHPMSEQILNAHETDPARVAMMCQQHGSPHMYMKHMPHHMLADFPMAWAKDCINVHLIRHPARVIASYAAKREAPTLHDIGFAQQADVYAQLGGIVIDSTDIRARPEVMLRGLCDAIGLDFDPAMLKWPAGPRAQDGIWASHWYGAVHKSMGIAGAEGPLPDITGELRHVLDAAMPYYLGLHERSLSP